MNLIYPSYCPRFIRWPYGETGKLVKYSANFGLQVVQWSVESGGLDKKTKDRVVENSRNGSIVLSHLIRFYDVIQSEEILKSLIEKGYKIKKVSDILKSEDIIPFTSEYFDIQEIKSEKKLYY